MLKLLERWQEIRNQTTRRKNRSCYIEQRTRQKAAPFTFLYKTRNKAKNNAIDGRKRRRKAAEHTSGGSCSNDEKKRTLNTPTILYI